MTEKIKNPIFLLLLAIFGINFYYLHNNVYCIDDLIYHFLEYPLSLFRDYHYGTWIMPFQNLLMYILPYKLGINFQDWAGTTGTTIKSLTMTGLMFCFLKTFLTEKISKNISCYLSLFMFFLLFHLFGQNKFVDFIIMSGFFRFLIPAALLIFSLYLVFKHFLGHKTNLFLILPVCFLTAWSSEIAAGILLINALVLLIYMETKAKNIKELLPYLAFLLTVLVGAFVLVSSKGFYFHLTDKLGTQAVSLSAIYGNLREFSKVFLHSLIIKYSLLWLCALLFIRYNLKKGEIKYNIFGFSVLLGVFLFGFALIFMGKTNYDGGFWIEHKDIYSVFIPAVLYSISTLALPFIKHNIDKKWLKKVFIALFIMSGIFFTFSGKKLYSELSAIKDYTYLRDKIRLFYLYKGETPIYPMSTHIFLADKNISGILKQKNDSDKYFDENFIKENSDGYSTLDKYYYPLNYRVKIEGDITPKFLNHKDGLKTFTQNGGSYEEVLKRKYRFKDLNNKDFVLNNL